jgi:hypothetical protein
MRVRATLATAAVICCAAGPVQAWPMIGVGVGASSGATENLEGPGFSAWGAALWPVEPWIRTGFMAHVDDQGTSLGSLQDPNDGTDLGTVPTEHRMVYGAAWRADFPFTVGGKWRGLTGASLGYYRVQDDRVGVIQEAFSATGASVSLGMMFGSRGGSDFGMSFRFHRVFDERLENYGSLTLDWTWSPGARAASSAGAAAPAERN